MTYRLRDHSLRLLPTQLRLDGTFRHSMASPLAPNLHGVDLTIEQSPAAIHLTLRDRSFCHSCTIDRMNDVRTVLSFVQQWIEDAVNGRLEAAA